MAFVDLLGGRLAEPEAEQIEAHVAQCSACRALIDELSRAATKELDPTATGETEDLLVREALRGGAGSGVESRVGTTLGQKYRLLRLLGRGGMGAVYEAEHLGTARRVAVKVIHGHLRERGREAESRFRREAKAAGAIDSPHIVAVLDTGQDEATGDLYLVLELLRGEDLQHLVGRVGPLLPDVALRVAAQALVGLARAHEAGIVHRDIKPANLFLARSDDGQVTVKLLDFGIAKVLPDAFRSAVTAGLTESGGLLGSPLYMSPEQMQSSRSVDHRTDLWSLGSALYSALSGRAPFRHVENVLELVVAVRSPEGPPSLRTLSPWVPSGAVEVVRRALAVDPEKRWPSAAAMLAAIQEMLPDGLALREEMLTGLPPSAREPGSPPSTSKPPTRSAPRRAGRRALAIAAVVVAAAATAAGLLVLRHPADRAPRANTSVPVDPLVETVAEPGPILSPPAPSPTEPLRRVTVQVSPEDAAVEVDGARVEVQNGAFAIAGSLGSRHRVRVSGSGTELATDVLLTEDGAVPPRVQLPRPAPAKGAAPKHEHSGIF